MAVSPVRSASPPWDPYRPRLTSFDGFNIIMNFLVMPMFFLSGAMYLYLVHPACAPAADAYQIRSPTATTPLKRTAQRRHSPAWPEFPLALDLLIGGRSLGRSMLTFAACRSGRGLPPCGTGITKILEFCPIKYYYVALQQRYTYFFFRYRGGPPMSRADRFLKACRREPVELHPRMDDAPGRPLSAGYGDP